MLRGIWAIRRHIIVVTNGSIIHVYAMVTVLASAPSPTTEPPMFRLGTVTMTVLRSSDIAACRLVRDISVGVTIVERRLLILLYAYSPPVIRSQRSPAIAHSASVCLICFCSDISTCWLVHEALVT
jgi:hypothetical protein